MDRTLIMTMGLPGAGKTTLCLQRLEEVDDDGKAYGYQIVNLDAIRLAIHGQAFVRQAEPMVMAIAHYMVDSMFAYGCKNVILDATNMKKEHRDNWKRGAWNKRILWNFPASAILCKDRYFKKIEQQQDLPKEERVRMHATMVNVIERMVRYREEVTPEEGFDYIIHIHI